MVRQSNAVAQKRLGNLFSQHCRRVRSVAAARRDASHDASSARASSAFFRLPIRPRRTMTNVVMASHSTPPWPRMQKNSGGRGKSQSLARLRGQLVSCRNWMSLPAMPALVPIERKTSVTQSSGEEGEEPDEARGEAARAVACANYGDAGPVPRELRHLRCQEYASRANTPEIR